MPAPCLLQLTRLELFAQQKVVYRGNVGRVWNAFPLLLAFVAAATSVLSAGVALPTPAWAAVAVLFGAQAAVDPIVGSFLAARRALRVCQYVAGPRLFALARVMRRVSAQRAASPCSPPA